MRNETGKAINLDPAEWSEIGPGNRKPFRAHRNRARNFRVSPIGALAIGAALGITLAFLTGCASEPPCTASAETCAQLEIAQEIRRARRAAILNSIGDDLVSHGAVMRSYPTQAPAVIVPPVGTYTGAGVGACYGGSVGKC